MTESSRNRIVVAARALIVHRNHVLLLRAVEDVREYYFLPGGAALHGERLEDACLREVREETGLDVRVVRPLYLREFIASRHRRRAAGMPQHHHALALVFLCELTGSVATLAPQDLGVFARDTGADTVQGLTWLPLDGLTDIEIHPPQLKSALINGLPPHGVEFWPED